MRNCVSGFHQQKGFGRCKPEERERTRLCHTKVRLRVTLPLLCLFGTELGIACFVPVWNFVYMVERKGKCFNIFYQVHLILLE